MEMTKRLGELSGDDRKAIARMFGLLQPAGEKDTLVLRTSTSDTETQVSAHELPEWCNVLEGLSDDDLRELQATFELPVRIAHSRE